MESALLRVLLVEDNPGDVYLVREMLRNEGRGRIDLLTTNRIARAVEILSESWIDAILLDLGLPDENGLETLRMLRETSESVPIVILSGLEDESLAVSAIQLGAQDFLIKGTISGHLLARSIFYAIKRKEMDSQLRHLASHDTLTNLANRKLFYERINRSIELSERNQKIMALVFLDLNDFKAVNDSFGHTAGDILLKEFAHRLRIRLRRTDVVARIGGDEFAIILDSVVDANDVSTIVQHVIEEITYPYELDPDLVSISVSVGISLYPLDGKTAGELIRKADRAMYQGKESGTSRFRFYNNDMEQSERNRRRLQEEIVLGIRNGDMRLFYQPKLNLRTGEIFGMEALIRWNHPTRGVLLPEHFLPAIQGSEMIVTLGDWVIREAVRQMDEWQKNALHLPVSVNVDVLQLKKPEFLGKLKDALLAYPEVPPQFLELEILETTAMGDFPEIRALFDTIHREGVGLSLDDFGTGYSSLAYLKNLPFDTLKIDRSFVMDMIRHREDLAIIESVSSLANIFDRKVIAEGMERPEYGAILLHLGCDRAQGFAIAPPMPSQEVSSWIAQWEESDSRIMSFTTQAEISDIALLNAQSNHLAWIQEALSGRGQPSTDLFEGGSTPSLHHLVQEWLEGNGQERYGTLPAFQEIRLLDEVLQRTCDKFLEQIANGDPSDVHEISSGILSTKDALLGKYAELQKEFLLSSLISGQSH
ncbi:MAG: putative bifunctional diguanylate cyclase/phosphodiesterase [Leptospirales bacterium]